MLGDQERQSHAKICHLFLCVALGSHIRIRSWYQQQTVHIGISMGSWISPFYTMCQTKACSVCWSDNIRRPPGPSKMNAVLKLLLAVEGAKGTDEGSM